MRRQLKRGRLARRLAAIAAIPLTPIPAPIPVAPIPMTQARGLLAEMNRAA
jgi:hypothetical protein